ncbi:hypothetical protein PHYSODRAFT_527744 [Phytophthora sojae]|uniref:Ankyrin repeat protein n=1 Tax=Phytophthora sojae (strain P6497) TaxID=1094619 RepID=G5A7Z9_PHYSP|nr:hypothetical protein PHYSODRAFT_526736 [Phytophthora sojae]XP_009536197.1 hypothetical protein PHYSODRAFT_527744 [Phytophthora sojae]EGZ08020.1 hypothetical protein PHYSODRAFT_526736 [Phytophthora sojae]EGZ08025.1 hypothetical protein PHYSODRAFT_527744 [Phytophthora sojae]|eukprot:XP_009536192.1 hypothetical protein PHYSODRAFT_526736 [Phytophthora sojae]
MVELLMEQGACLGSHDCRGQKFHWHDRDIYGDSALMLASRTANTPVTMQLLNEINIVRYAKQNHPFKVLKRAIKSDNERHAMEVAMHENIQSSINNPEVTRFKGSGKPELSWTLSKCTEAAFDRGMTDLV